MQRLRCSMTLAGATEARRGARSTRSTSSSPPRRPTTARTSTARSPSRWRGWRSFSGARARRGCEGVISTSFGCPYEGHVPPERVLEIATSLRDAGAQEIGFGDTTGMANPRQVREFFADAAGALGAEVELTAHFHNTRGQGLANVLAALEAGVESFESSFGELGGCPVPAGATGNIASEDLVSMLHEMGIETGIDLGALIEASRAAQEILGRPLGSHTLLAGPVSWAGIAS